MLSMLPFSAYYAYINRKYLYYIFFFPYANVKKSRVSVIWKTKLFTYLAFYV